MGKPRKTRKTGKGKKSSIYLMYGCSNKSSTNRNRNKYKKGGSGCGSTGCPIPAFSWKQMNSRGGYKDVMSGEPILGVGAKGGSSFYKLPGPLPGPIVGSAWGAPVDQWPGIDGIGSNRNWLAYNTYTPDISRQMKLGGSKSKKNSTRRSYKKGGGLIPQDLVNVGRDFSFNVNSAYNTLNGYKSPIDPLPYKDQLHGSLNVNRLLM